MILERHVADVCPTCGGNRDAHVVFRTSFRKVSVPAECKTREACEREALKVATDG